MATKWDFVVERDVRSLAATLAARINDWRKDNGALAPVELLVAHRAMRKWLPLELAALTGASAHLLFTTSEAIIRPDGQRREGWRRSLMAALNDNVRTSQPHFAAARAYLDAARDEGRTESERAARRLLRRYHLADRLAATFATYQAHQPQLIKSWEQGDHNARDQWQAELWKHIQQAPMQESVTAPSPPPLFVFDLPLPGHDLVQALRQRPGPVTVLQVAQPAVQAHPMWSRHGRQRAEARTRWIGNAEEPSARDGADSPLPHVELVGAPGDRRACETAVAQIWQWVRDSQGAAQKDPSAPAPLRFHEIAVVMPSGRRDELLPVLREAMQSAHDLPKVLWNLPLAETSRVAGLARQLLELPAGPMRRPDMLSILRHPLMADQFGGDHHEEWLEWLDAAGILHGRDQRDHAGTYLQDRPSFHWDQGLKRLALGAFMGSDRSGQSVQFPSADGPLVPQETTQSAQGDRGALLQLVRSLLADASTLASTSLNASQWRSVLVEYLTTYIRPRENASRRNLGAVLRSMDALERLGTDDPLPYSVVRAMVLQALARLPADVGNHITQGIVVGTPDQLRGLPWRRLVVLGLEAGAYPSRGHHDELDLRPLRPVPLDNSRRSDEAAFYDLLHSTEESALLLYVNADPDTGETWRPSLLVPDLEAELRRRGHTLSQRTVATQRRQEATETSSATAWALPESTIEKHINAVGADRVDQLPPDWQGLLRATVPAPQDKLPTVVEVSLKDLALYLRCPVQGYVAHHLGWPGPDEDRGLRIDEPFDIDVLPATTLFRQSLSRWLLESPGREPDDVAARRLNSVLDQAVSHERVAGRTPHGTLETYALQRLRPRTELAGSGITQARKPDDEPAWQLRWGVARGLRTHGVRSAPCVERPLTVAGRPVTVRLTGESGLICNGGALSVLLTSALRISAMPNKQWKAARAGRMLLEGWLEHLMLTLAGLPGARTTLLIDRDGASISREWSAVDEKVAGARIDALLTDLLSDRADYKCPAVALFYAWDALAPEIDWEQRQGLLNDLCETVYDGYRPIETNRYSALPHLSELPLPGLQALDRVRARLKPFFDEATQGPGLPTPTKGVDE